MPWATHHHSDRVFADWKYQRLMKSHCLATANPVFYSHLSLFFRKNALLGWQYSKL